MTQLSVLFQCQPRRSRSVNGKHLADTHMSGVLVCPVTHLETVWIRTLARIYECIAPANTRVDRMFTLNSEKRSNFGSGASTVRGRKHAAHVNVSYVHNKLHLFIFIYKIRECVRACKKTRVSLPRKSGRVGVRARR